MKKFLIISAKNAVNVILVNILPMIFDGDHFNVTTIKGWEHIGLLAVSAIASRELIVWVPEVLKWSNSPTNGGQ